MLRETKRILTPSRVHIVFFSLSVTGEIENHLCDLTFGDFCSPGSTDIKMGGIREKGSDCANF
jgi:hypothetical protein